jgi:hypothetical protein
VTVIGGDRIVDADANEGVAGVGGTTRPVTVMPGEDRRVAGTVRRGVQARVAAE